MKLIDKEKVVAEIESLKSAAETMLTGKTDLSYWKAQKYLCERFLSFINTIEVKEVGVWKTVDNINLPQADRNKIYCVLSKNKYLLARVVNHPHDELLQWSCTEFPFHRYDMCEGDKYMQIV